VLDDLAGASEGRDSAASFELLTSPQRQFAGTQPTCSHVNMLPQQLGTPLQSQQIVAEPHITVWLLTVQG
jgi:hypothetical protein